MWNCDSIPGVRLVYSLRCGSVAVLWCSVACAPFTLSFEVEQSAGKLTDEDVGTKLNTTATYKVPVAFLAVTDVPRRTCELHFHRMIALAVCLQG